MKLLATMLAVWVASFGMAQVNQITNFTLIPANPQPTDDVLLIVDVQFASSGCEDQELIYTITTNTIFASSHHCIGMLAAICNDQDSFALGQLPAGNYDFILTLTSGGGPGPCTPGIVPDDVDTFSFTVSGGVGLEEPERVPRFTFSPNPAHDEVRIQWNHPENASVQLLNMLGQEVKQTSMSQSVTMNVRDLPSGIYFIKLVAGETEQVQKLVIR